MKNTIGQRRLTRDDIAREAGVSPSTVSRALSGSPLLPQVTIDRIRRVAAELGYRPNVLARRLASNRSFQLGFVVPPRPPKGGPFHVSYYSGILDAVVQAAFLREYTVTILPGFQTRKELANLGHLVSGREVDGLMFIGLQNDQRGLHSLIRKKVPLVLIGAGGGKANLPSINCDPEPGIRAMLQELEKTGCQRLFYVHGNLQYLDALRQQRLIEHCIQKSSITLAEIIPGDYSLHSGEKAADRIIPISHKGDAVFLANDRMAAGFYHQCQKQGVRIPRDIAVIGSDDDYAASTLYPSLSTLHQPRTEIGQAATEMLIEILNDKKVVSVDIPMHFVRRESI